MLKMMSINLPIHFSVSKVSFSDLAGFHGKFCAASHGLSRCNLQGGKLIISTTVAGNESVRN